MIGVEVNGAYKAYPEDRLHEQQAIHDRIAGPRR